jgi:hypothetical protein
MTKQIAGYPGSRMAIWRKVIFALLIFTFLIGALKSYEEITIQRGLLRILVAVTPGMRKADVVRRLGIPGRPETEGVDPVRDINVAVPPGGNVLLFDSYMITPIGHSTDFVVVFDRQDRVVGYEFSDQPLGWK